MPTPDAIPYIDLLLSDLDPQDIFDQATQQLSLLLPGWQAREGNTEVVLLEAIAVEIAEAVYAINRVPSAVLQALLRLYGLEYDPGTQPTSLLRLYLSSNVAVTIPDGTEALLQLPNGLDPITFSTNNEITVAGGTAFVEISATGDRFTSDANGVVQGTVMEAIDSLSFLDRIEIGTGGVSGGVDEETDDDFFNRGTNLLYRLTNALVTPAQFVSAMLEEAYVYRAFAVDNYNILNDTNNNGPYGTDPGHITLYAYGTGSVLTTDQKASLLAKVTPLAMSALAIHLGDPTITTVSVTCVVKSDLGYDYATTIANATQAIQDYLSPATWDWSNQVRINDLIAHIGNAPGVAYVDSFVTPVSDIFLPGAAPLAQYGTINVTVSDAPYVPPPGGGTAIYDSSVYDGPDTYAP